MVESGEPAEAIDISVVVAHNVTREMLMAIPKDWARGLVFVLRADGVLVLDDIESYEHKALKTYVSHDIVTSVNQHRPGYRVMIERFDQFIGRQPDVTLLWERPDLNPNPFLVVEVEVRHRSVNGFSELVKDHLQDARVHVIFGCVMFSARCRLQKAVLAVVFKRIRSFIPGQAQHIQIVHEVSFGNVPLGYSVPLGRVPSVANAIVPRQVVISPSVNDGFVIQRIRTQISRTFNRNCRKCPWGTDCHW